METTYWGGDSASFTPSMVCTKVCLHLERPRPTAFVTGLSGRTAGNDDVLEKVVSGDDVGPT